MKGRYKFPQRKHGNLEFSTSCVKSGQGLVRVKGHIHFLNQDKNESKLMVSFVDHMGCLAWCQNDATATTGKLSIDLAVQEALHHHCLVFNVASDCVEIRYHTFPLTCCFEQPLRKENHYAALKRGT